MQTFQLCMPPIIVHPPPAPRSDGPSIMHPPFSWKLQRKTQFWAQKKCHSVMHPPAGEATTSVQICRCKLIWGVITLQISMAKRMKRRLSCKPSEYDVYMRLLLKTRGAGRDPPKGVRGREITGLFMIQNWWLRTLVGRHNPKRGKINPGKLPE